MASIKKRAEAYEITVSMGRSPDGKKIVKTTTYKPEAKTPKAIEKEVDEYAREFEKRVKEGKYTSGERMTFSKFFTVWEKDWAVQHLTESVLEHYKSAITIRVLPQIGALPMSKILPVHVQGIINDEVKQGLAFKTIQYTFTAINSVFKFAYRMGVIIENPCLRVELPKDRNRSEELHYFTLDQAKRFLASLKVSYPHVHKGHTRILKKTGEAYTVPDYVEHKSIPIQFQAFFTLAIYGGFRRGELLALTWQDIDFERKSVSIDKAVAVTDSGRTYTKDPKTRAGKREIMLPADCFILLDQWKRDQAALALKMGSAWKGRRGTAFDQNYIFIQDSGEMMNPHTPYHKFRELIELYNTHCEREEDKLPAIRLHDLRHTSATLLLAEGVDIATISKRLGHARISVTLDTYSHALKRMDEKASQVLERMFN